MYGSGSFPLQWPGVLAALAASMAARDLVIPGHGSVVDRAFVARQAGQLQLVADRIRAAHDEGLTAAEALARHHDWPIPLDFVVNAVERAYTAARSDVAVDVVPATPLASEATRLVQLAAVAVGAMPGDELHHTRRVERAAALGAHDVEAVPAQRPDRSRASVGRVDGCHVASRYSAAPVANAV